MANDNVLDGEARPPMGSSTFLRLAVEAHHELIGMVRGGSLPVADLTYAAEAVGRVPDRDVAIQVLRELLEHPHPMVREGAILGLTHLGTPVGRALVAAAASGDASVTVRQVAEDALESLRD